MNSVKIFFAGDFCCCPTTAGIEVSEELRDRIRSCDLRVVNFETPLKPDIALPDIQYKRYFQHDDAPAFLRGMGFNLFQMANNHAFDWGDEGYRKTRQALGDDGFGAGSYDEAYRVKVVEAGGLRIGFMALTYAAYFGVFDDVEDHDGLGCAYIHDLRVNHDIMAARREVDYLFVLPHDGIEYIDVPLPETRARYRDLIDYGADAVIGTHPHCPQGWETYKGKQIFYSLGNFFFNGTSDPDHRVLTCPHWYEGLCLEAVIDESGLRFTPLNIRNENNRRLMTDPAAERTEHNDRLCAYLHDKPAYDRCLSDSLSRLAVRQELPIIDTTIHAANLKRVAKAVVRKTRDILLKRDQDHDRSMRMLMKNDSRRQAVVRYMSHLRHKN